MGSWYNGFDLVRDIRQALIELDYSKNTYTLLSEPEFLLFHQRLINFVESVVKFTDYYDSENNINIS